MAAAGLTKSKLGLVPKSTAGLSTTRTMSTGDYMKARATADIARVRKAYNSPTAKKVRSSAKGFGASVAKASRRTVKAGKQARKLYERLR